MNISGKLSVNKISSTVPTLNASATPLATPSYDTELTPGITPVPSDFPMIPSSTTTNINSIIDLPAITQDQIITLDYEDTDHGDMDTDDTDLESVEMSESPRGIHEALRSYSDSDLNSNIAINHPINPMVLSNSAPKPHPHASKRNIMEPMVAGNQYTNTIYSNYKTCTIYSQQ